MRLACIRIPHSQHKHTFNSMLRWSSVCNWQCNEWIIMCDYWNELFTPASSSFRWHIKRNWMTFTARVASWWSNAPPLTLHFTETWKFDFTTARDCHQKLFKFAFTFWWLPRYALSYAVTVNSSWINISFFQNNQEWVK
jgi:hypothetical protein